MGILYKIKKDLKRDKIRDAYADKHRLIPTGLYTELKSKKECMHCKKPFNGAIPEIHHIKPLSQQGTNDKKNLMSVHHKCHKILDKEAKV